MKHLLFFFALLLLSCSPQGDKTSDTKQTSREVREIHKPTAENTVELVSSDEQSTRVRLALPGLMLVTENTPEGEFHRLATSNGDRSIFIHGEGFTSLPEIPMHTFLVALPLGAKPSEVEVKPSGENTIEHVRLYPVQPPYFATTEEEPISEFVFDKERYASLPFPGESRYNAEQISSEPANIWRISVPAATYNPEGETLTLFEILDLNITYSVANPCFLYTRQSREFKLDPVDIYRNEQYPYYEHLVINPLVFRKYGCPFPGIFIALGAEFLIVTDPSFLSAAQNLRSHKESLGIRTRVVTTTRILSDEGATTLTDDVIRDWINNFRNTTLIQTKWLLLLGDAEFIPTHYISIESNGTRCAGDQYYGQMTSDTLSIPTLGIGRFPVDSLADAQRLVDRVIAYELNPPPGWSFYKSMAFAAEFQDNEPDGTANRWFTETSENIRDHLLPLLYNVERIYKTRDTVNPQFYNNGTPIPSELERPGFAWDGSAGDIINAVNEGRIILYHRDHGSKNGWGKPSFGISNLSSISITDNEHPLVYSINCASGVFDNETANLPANLGSGTGMNVSVNSAYWAETFFRQEHGAIGVIGDTRNSSTTMNNRMAKGLFDAMFPAYQTFGGSGAINRMGDVLNHAKGYVASSSSSTNAVYKENTIYNLFGDPTLEVRPQVFFIVMPGIWLLDDMFWILDYELKPIECDKCPDPLEWKPERIIGTLINPKTGEVMARTVSKAGESLKFDKVNYQGPATVVLSGNNMQSKSFDVTL